MRPRNWLYHNYILADIKKETLAEGGELSAEEREIVRSVRSVREYDDRFISPRYGFRGADDYYELCAPLNYMPEIRVPTMVLAAPTIRGFRRSTIATSNGRTIRSLLPVMAEGGGHLGFHARRQRPAVVRHGAGEIPRTSLTGEFDTIGVSSDRRSTCRPSGRAFPGGAATCRPSPTGCAAFRRRSRRMPANG